jgi:hypothetical protein
LVPRPEQENTGTETEHFQALELWEIP